MHDADFGKCNGLPFVPGSLPRALERASVAIRCRMQVTLPVELRGETRVGGRLTGQVAIGLRGLQARVDRRKPVDDVHSALETSPERVGQLPGDLVRSVVSGMAYDGQEVRVFCLKPRQPLRVVADQMCRD